MFKAGQIVESLTNEGALIQGEKYKVLSVERVPCYGGHYDLVQVESLNALYSLKVRDPLLVLRAVVASKSVTLFETREYRNNHGAEPRGRGSWAFALDREGQNDMRWFHQMTYGEAKQAARASFPAGSLLWVQP
jgi:hypothetical protein